MAYKNKEDLRMYQYRWKFVNRDHLRQIQQNWRKQNIIQVKERQKRWYETHKEQERKRHADYIERSTKEIFIVLGRNSCERCGYDKDTRALQIDHINNDGNEDRKRLPTRTQLIAYYRKHPDEAREKLQILCANCNTIKEAKRRSNN